MIALFKSWLVCFPSVTLRYNPNYGGASHHMCFYVILTALTARLSHSR